MKHCHGLDEFPTTDVPVVLAIGSFDGVHLGHQAIIRSLIGQATGLEGEAWVMTFSPHPRAVLAPEKAPQLISPGQQQVDLLSSMQLDGVLQLPFTIEVASQSPQAFFDLLVEHIPQLAVIAVGGNFRFGCRAEGDVALLKELASAHGGMSIFVADEVREGSEWISSTRIRGAIQAGALRDVEGMLGRSYTIQGPVVDGKKHGRKVGFPTANVASENPLLPPPGIYALRVRIGNSMHAAAGYIAAESPDVVEAHVLDFDGDLYGQTLVVSLVERVREHIDFTDEPTLIAQIADDVQQIRELLDR